MLCLPEGFRAKSRRKKSRRSAKRFRELARRAPLLEQLEQRLLLNADWQNTLNPLDVDGDRSVAPADVLVIFNELNAVIGVADDTGRLPVPNGQNSPPPFYDVNGDCFITPVDGLIIINALNEDFLPPVVTIGLLNDTALAGLNDDKITFDPTIRGMAVDRSGLKSVEIRIDGGAPVAVTFESGGRFTFDPGLAIDGTSDGLHTVSVVATDGRSLASTPTEFTFTLDTVAPIAALDLDSAFDSAVVGDRLTNFSTVSLKGQTEAAATVDIAPLATATQADATGQFALANVTLATGVNTFTLQATDVAGNSATSVERIVRADSPDAFALVESNPFAVELERAAELGNAGERRRLRVNLETLFDRTDQQSLVRDVFNVFVVDATDASQTLLDGRRPGMPVFSLDETGGKLAPGIASLQGSDLLIDVTSIAGEAGSLLFQLLSGDTDRNSLIIVDGVDAELIGGNPAQKLGNFQPPIAPGGAFDVSTLSPNTQLVSRIGESRFDATTGKVTATLTLTNAGGAVGRDVAVVLRGLPAGVTVENASATLNGDPVLNLRPATASGGLKQGQATAPVEFSINNPTNQRFAFDIDAIAGPPNRAPQLAAIDPTTMFPGEVLRKPIVAVDEDGDALTFAIVPIAGQPPLPSISLSQAGEITLRSLPDQLGSFQFEVRVSDGAMSTTQVVQLNVVADPNATTRISGVVKSTLDQPLEGVPIEIAGFSNVTDAKGAFTIELPTLKVPTEAFDISIPAGEPLFDPFNTGTQVIRFRRARHDVTTGDNSQDPRQHPNLVTSFLDASVVYGSDAERAGALRTLVDGKLKTSANDLLPLNDTATFPGGPLENDNEGRIDPTTLFATGDVRANENVPLIALHTVLVREHNRLADEIKAANPTFDDEQIYQHARRLIGGLLQQITYSEYLPMLLGPNAIPAYTGYDPDVDPRESSMFAVAAFRIGHTQTFSEILRLDENGQSLAGGPLALRDAFFTPEPIKTDGIEPYLLGLAASQAEQADAQVIDDLRNFLFGPPGAGGIDLASINIQRGRDMGLPSYNQTRADFGLPRVTDFSEISSDAAVQAALQATFGSVNKIDVWSGGISEDHATGSLVGPLFQKIIADQFQRARDGDRFWFENSQFTDPEQAFIRGTTLTSLIERNTVLSGLPANLFTTNIPPDAPDPAGSNAAEFAGEFRSIDGTGNNVDDPQLGSTRSNLLNNFTLAYGDGIATPGGADRPNPREISNGIHDQAQSVPNTAGATGFMVFWGQLIDHDLGLTPGGVSDTLRILGNQRPNPGGDEAFPFVAEPMDLLLGHSVLPGNNNVIARPIYLPVLDSGTTIDPEQTTVVQAANVTNASVTVAAQTLTNRTGQMFTGELSITEVPVALTPAALPANLFPDLVVTIQPADLVFSTPAPLTLPNLADTPAGTELDLFSINPITGEFDRVGTGRVSSNGQTVETIAGGIRNSSWHFFVTQTPPAQEQANNDPANNVNNQDQLCNDCEGKARSGGQSVATSEVELHSGALLEEHFLVSYQSLGVERGVSLHYDSLRADPRPIFHFNAVNASGDDTLVASLNVRRGNFEMQVPGFAGNQFGLQGGEHFFDLPAGINDVDAALQVDLRDQPTGVYDFNVTFGPRRFNGQRFTGSASQFSTPVSIINSINSPFGAGWDLAGLQTLIENPDGSVMLIDGDGTELLYKPTGAGQPFDSPAGDFSMFEQLGDGTYRRTFTDQTVVLFNADNRIASVTDRNNNQTTFNYDAEGFITEIVDPVGLTTTFTRTGDRITKITDPAQRETNLEYDDAGNLIRITDPDNTSRQFAYDDLHHLTQEIDQRGFSEQAVYGFHGRVTETLRKDGTRSVFEPAQTIGLLPAEVTSNPSTAAAVRPNSRQIVARFSDPNGNVTSSVLDKAGQIVSQTDDEGNLPSVVRNQDNLLLVINDGRGNGTYQQVDDRGNVTRVALEQNERSPTLFDGEVILSHDRVANVRLGDLDGDGDLDAVAGHGTTLNGSGSSQFVTIFKNDDGRLVRELDLQVFNAGTENIALADVDGDNILDIIIVTGDSANDRFRVMKGNGDLTFGFLSTIALTLDPTSVATGDVNGDGSPDVVISRGSSSDALLLINDGAGTFTESALSSGDRQFGVQLADVNGDGNLDAVFAGINSVRLMLGDGAGNFAPSVKLNTGSQTHDAVAVIDFNNDGRLDIISTAIFGVIQFFENDGSGGFIESAITVAVSGRFSDIAVADLNFDGFQDFVVSNDGSANSANAARVFLNDGLGRFSNQPTFVRSGTSPASVAVGDLDGDGDFELLIGNNVSNDVSVVYGKPDGSFLDNPALPAFSGANPRPKSIEMADLNADGNLDIVTALAISNTIAVQLGDGAGGFAQAVEFPATSNPQDLAIGDVNADGIPDVVVTENGAGRVVLLVGQGDGAFAAPQPMDNTTTALSVEIADVDGDGHSDIVLADSQKIEVLFGQSDGTFPSRSTIDTSNGVGLIEDDYMQVVDFDSDNDLDIVFGKSVFRIVKNNGLRQFTLDSIATDLTSTTVAKAKAADLNGDGHLDLIGLGGGQAFAPRDDRGGIVVRLSDGAGGFQAGMAFSAGGQTQDGFAIADFNLDGFLDIVTSTDADNNVAVLLGDGTGAFAPAEYFNIRSSSESSLAVGDIDRDGDIDIVTPSFDNRNITLLLNHTVFPCQQLSCDQTFEYDAAFSQLTRTVDELGRQRLFEIDPATGNTLRETIVIGQPDATSGESDDLVTQFTYTAQGLLDTTTDPLGRVTDFDYDAQGRLTATTFAVGTPDEAVRRFEYNTAGNVTAEVDENNHRTEFQYDALNRVTLIRDALSGETTFSYDARGNVISSSDELAQTTRFEYDSMNRLVRETDAVDNSTTFEYDGFGNLTRQVDRLGRETQFRYDARNRLIETTDAERGVSTFQYDEDNNIVALTDENGNPTRFAYDQRNRQTHRFDALGGLFRTLVDAAGFSVTDIDELGRRTDNFRDDADRMIEIQHPDPDGDGPAQRPTWQFQFDKAGNTTGETDPRGNVTQFEYDSRNRLVTKTEADPDGAGPLASPVTTFEYDDRSLLTKLTDPLNRVSTFEYDALERLTRSTAPDPDGAGPQSAPVNVTIYNAVDNVLSVTDPLGNVTAFEYDTLNRRTRTTQPDPDGVGPLDSPVITVQYDAEGQVLSVTDPLNRTSRIEYDRLGRTIRSIAPDPDRAGPNASPITQFQYDAFGNTIAAIDPLGNQTDFEYDALHRLVRVTEADPDGAGPKQRPISRQIYDAASQLIAEIDPLGRRTDITFDELGRVIALAEPDPDGDGPDARPVIQFEFDLIGNVTAVIDPLGNRTENVYDHLNRLVQLIQPDPDGAGPASNPISNVAFDAAGQILSTIDPLGREVQFTYDSLGRIIASTHPDPDGAGPLTRPVYQTAFDLVGNLTSVTDAIGRVTTFEYDNLYRQTTVTLPDPDGAGPGTSPISRFTYDAAGQQLTLSDPLQRITAFAYDDLGRLVQRTDPDPDAAGPLASPVTTFTFDAAGQNTSIIDPLGNITRFEFDNLLRHVRTMEADPDGAGPLLSPVSEFDYDVANQMITETDPLGRVTTFEYDNLSRVVRRVSPDPDGAGLLESPSQSFVFDLVDNLLSSTDALGHATTYTYDDLYRRITETDANGDTTQFEYDSVGKRTAIVDPLNNRTAYEYDGLDRLILTTDPLLNTTQFAYDPVNNLIERTDRLGRVIQYQYDDLDRRVGEQWLDAGNVVRTLAYEFDNADQLLSDSDPAASHTYQYDALGRMTNSVTRVTGFAADVAFDYQYDSVGNMLRHDASVGATKDFVNEYTFDNLHRKTQSLQSADGGNAVAEKRVDFTYDVASQLDALTRFANLAGTQLVVTSTYAFDAASRLTDLTHAKGGTNLADYDWIYDAANRITQFNSLADGLATFTYDARNQLTDADYATQDDLAFTYDDNGNRIGGGNVVGANNRTTSDDTFDYEYDAEGNRTKRTNRTSGAVTEYAWDHRNRLTQVTERPSDGAASSQIVAYAYDTLNRWVASTVDRDGAGPNSAQPRFFFYQGNNIVLEFDGPDAADVAHRYLWGVLVDQILADEQVTDPSQPGNILWTLGDNQGTIRDLVEYDANTDTSTVANHKQYDAFGNVTSETDAAIDSLFGYTGRPFDDASGLQNNLNRWYDAALGKWLSEDPIGFEGGDANLGRYVGNEPLRFVDPLGLDFSDAFLDALDTGGQPSELKPGDILKVDRNNADNLKLQELKKNAGNLPDRSKHERIKRIADAKRQRDAIKREKAFADQVAKRIKSVGVKGFKELSKKGRDAFLKQLAAKYGTGALKALGKLLGPVDAAIIYMNFTLEALGVADAQRRFVEAERKEAERELNNILANEATRRENELAEANQLVDRLDRELQADERARQVQAELDFFFKKNGLDPSQQRSQSSLGSTGAIDNTFAPKAEQREPVRTKGGRSSDLDATLEAFNLILGQNELANAGQPPALRTGSGGGTPFVPNGNNGSNALSLDFLAPDSGQRNPVTPGGQSAPRPITGVSRTLNQSRTIAGRLGLTQSVICPPDGFLPGLDDGFGSEEGESKDDNS